MEYLRISGIYDENTIHFLKQKGVQKFTFDQRPTCFNFIQSSKISELINQTYQYGDEYCLKFDLDKDFVIASVIDRIETNSPICIGNLVLEFASARSIEECEQFKRPFIWHYDDHDHKKFLNSSLLHTVVFKESLLQQLELSQKIYSFMSNFFEQCPKRVKVELEMEWTSPILSTLIDFFPINGLNYSINSRVEKSFRHVDLQLVGQHIEHTILNFNK